MRRSKGEGSHREKEETVQRTEEQESRKKIRLEAVDVICNGTAEGIACDSGMEMKQLNLDQIDTSLFEEVLSVKQLATAYKAVRANRGAPGVDGVSVEAFGEDLEVKLEHLGQEVREWRYKPSPVRRVRIPKPDGDERLLGIPCVRDRVLQYSLKITLEPYFEKHFSKSSYGFRPGKNQKQAIDTAQKLVREGREWVVDIDLEKFFDRINHDKVIHLVRVRIADPRILRLIGMVLRSGILEGDQIVVSEEGSIQGSPLSPLLSNIVLDELDKEIERRGLHFCRYADDCNLYVRSKKAAERVKESITKFIETRLKLKVNQAKSKVSLASGVKFLGFTILFGAVVISQKSMAQAMETVDTLTPRGTHLTLEKQIAKINAWYVGWSGYYERTEYPWQLATIEAHLRRRLRARMIHDQKRPRHLREKFVSLGVPRPTARLCAYRGNIWRKSISKAANRAWNNKWFRSHGLRIRSEDGLAHWFSRNSRVSFP